MKNNLIKNQIGVTLVETLIVMGLLSIMLVILSTIFTSAADVQKQSASYSATNVNGRFIMARLNYDIAQASSIITPNAPGASSSNLDLIINGSSESIGLNGSDLEISDTIGSANLNNSDSNISDLSFQEIGTSSSQTVIYSFKVTSKIVSFGKNDSQTFTSSVELKP